MALTILRWRVVEYNNILTFAISRFENYDTAKWLVNLCGCDVDCMASHKWRALFSTHFSAMKIIVSAFQWVALLKLILSCYLFLFLFFAFLSCGLRVRFLFTLLLNNDHSIRYSLFRGALKMRERKFISAVNDNSCSEQVSEVMTVTWMPL